ncbi:hypothetical protein OG470_30685 [Micromonospora sp. NBC_00389]|uniref:hypothetical protein n=1 Tax=Micromonospora sp. NBC_00389 TaxID=2903586 RepID=UPI002E1BC11B
MVRSGASWGKLFVAGLMVLCSGIRTPDILAEGSWRSWTVVPVLVGVLWFFLRALGDVLRRRDLRGETANGVVATEVGHRAGDE